MVTRHSILTPILQYGSRLAPLTAVERRTSRPEANSADDTASPSRASTAFPSTWIVTDLPVAPSARLNILVSSAGQAVTKSVVAIAVLRHAAEAVCRESLDQLRFAHALHDHAGDVEGVVGSQRHAGMAAGDESAGMGRRLVIDRKTVLRHHADAGPAPDHVEPAEMREHALRAIGHHGVDRMVLHAVVELLLPAVADHHSALVGLADRGQGMRLGRHGALGHDDLAAGRAHRRR